MRIQYYSGYRTFRVGFNADGASVYRTSLAFIFFEKIYKGGTKRVDEKFQNPCQYLANRLLFCLLSFPHQPCNLTEIAKTQAEGLRTYEIQELIRTQESVQASCGQQTTVLRPFV